MDNFLLLKLNRSIWVALLEQKKIVEAINYYETYRNNFMMIQNDKNFQMFVIEELTISQAIFLAKLNILVEDYMKEKNYSDALICYTAIFKYDQTNITHIRNYIKCLNELDLTDLAQQMSDYLETIAPADAESYKQLADMYNENKNYKKAIECYNKYLEFRGGNISAVEYNQLGCYYNLLYSDVTAEHDDVVKSYDYFKKASEMEPYSHLFHKNATIMASKANKWTECKSHWDRLLEMGNLSNDDKYDYAAYCIKNSDFEGWNSYFGSRFGKETNRTQYPKLSKPEWNGVKNLEHSTLLIHYEQGYGDTFLMWGYMPRLKAIAKHVIFVVQDNVAELLKNNEWGIEVIPKSLANLDTIKYDYHLPSMSIPAALKLNRENISVGEGFIKANSGLVDEYKAKYFNNDKLKIGISLSGNASGNKTRDISLENLLPLDKLENVEIYCLTMGVDDKALEVFKNHKIQNVVKDFTNFAQTAAAIENLDVVISADNCILNLAGALGKKTIGLFNWHYEFRWFDLSGENTVWLTSVKPFVNDKQNNWASSVDLAVKEIKKMM